MKTKLLPCKPVKQMLNAKRSKKHRDRSAGMGPDRDRRKPLLEGISSGNKEPEPPRKGGRRSRMSLQGGQMGFL